MPRLRAASWNTTDENMFPCSVTATDFWPSFGRLIQQLLDAAGAVEQRELGVQVEVDEVRHGGLGPGLGAQVGVQAGLEVCGSGSGSGPAVPVALRT